jgi:pimeloyl-ACP methyl ester carboxylesterase
VAPKAAEFNTSPCPAAPTSEWNRIWLAPEFRTWSIEEELSSITCPVLAVQGINDEYGSLAQIRDIQKYVPSIQLLELNDCGHSPYRDQPQALTQACVNFTQAHCQPQVNLLH